MPQAVLTDTPTSPSEAKGHRSRRLAAFGTLLTLLASLFVLVPAQAATAASAPLLPIGPNGAVTATAVDSATGTTYVGGSFTRWGVQTGAGAGVGSDGEVKRAFPAVTGGTVLASAPDGAGGFYIGGTFTAVGGEVHTRVAHILGDGTVDSGWTPSASDAVRTISVVGTTVYVGGSFTSVTSSGGTSANRSRLAAFGADGSVRSWAPSVSNTVFALVATNTTVYVGGGFTSVALGGGVVASRSRLAAFSATGSGSLTDWAPAADWNVAAMTLVDSTLYIGGSFTSITPVGGSATPRGRLAAISADTTGTLTSWAPSVDGTVSALKVFGIQVYVGGNFTSMSGGVGAAKPRSSLGLVGTEGVGTLRDWAPAVSGSVSTIEASSSDLLIGGKFSSVTPAGGTATSRDNIASLARTGGSLNNWNLSADGEVSTILLSGQTTFVGGAFTMLGGSVRDRLAAFDSSGALTSWAPSVNGAVAALAVADSRVFVGGAFTTATGMGGTATNRSYLAAFSLDGATLTSWAPVSNGSVNTFVVSGSTLYLGGPFSYITPVGGSATLRYNLAGISTTGTGTLSALSVGFDDAVRTLQLVGDTLYVGGSFTQAKNGSGSWTTRRRAASVNLASAGSLNSWAPSFDNAVTSLAVADTTVYVGGYFTQVYISNAWVSRNRIAAVTTAGVFTDWKPAFNERVDAIVVNGSKVYLGGAFTSVTPVGGSATSRKYLAVIDAAGSGAVGSWAPSADAAVSSLKLVSPTELAVAGSFSMIAGSGLFAGAGLATVPIAVSPPVPGTPTLVSAGADNLTVTWVAPSAVWNPVTGYDITFSSTRNGSYTTPTSGSCATSVSGTSCTIEGLRPSRPYYVKVMARNADGTSETSAASALLRTLPAGTGPGVPSSVLVTPGNTTIGISWAPPADTGGRSISGYRVCLDSTCSDVAADVRSQTFTSLINGESHNVSVAAITVDGVSLAVTSASAARTVPTAPAVSASNPNAGTIVLDWIAPSSDGGSAVTGYRVCLTSLICQSLGASAITATFTGVSNTAYSPSVVAVNAAGNSMAGTSSITPITAPSAPTPVVMTVGNTTVTVGWSGSAASGGSVITGYTVCLNATCRSVSAATTSSQFTGLTNGVSHTATVTATNSWGTSATARGYIATGTAVASGANLSSKDLRGWNLSGFNLTNTNFGGANLTGADLSGATFTGASLRNANLTDARIVNSNLSGMSGEGLAYTTLTRTDFTGSDLRQTWVN
ncbi:MAG: hypothetical protein F2520_09825, partial [Actinobacteria bacterium]|nr:hypothetical protein [Actinomycetota bacterium]